MNKSLTIALLIGLIDSSKLEWISGLSSFENVSDEYAKQKESNKLPSLTEFAQGLIEKQKDHIGDAMNLDKIKSIGLAQVKSKQSIGNKWIELPDCSKFGDVDGNLTVPVAQVIQLRDDLSNAIIATCKGAMPMPWPAPPLPWNYWNDTDGNRPQSVIYDPILKIPTGIPDGEHQLAIDANGTVTHSQNPVGPKGDFYNVWNYPYQSKDTQWDFAGAQNPYTSVPQPVPSTAWTGIPTVTQNETPPVATLLQFDNMSQRKWVELPDCAGNEGEVALKGNIVDGKVTYNEAPSGATAATCKKRPGVSTDQSAASALESMTPTAQ